MLVLVPQPKCCSWSHRCNNQISVTEISQSLLAVEKWVFHLNNLLFLDLVESKLALLVGEGVRGNMWFDTLPYHHEVGQFYIRHTHKNINIHKYVKYV